MNICLVSYRLFKRHPETPEVSGQDDERFMIDYGQSKYYFINNYYLPSHLKVDVVGYLQLINLLKVLNLDSILFLWVLEDILKL